MSDVELSELRRRWITSGSSDDEARYLTARVRSGELTEDRLKLAALLGYPAALKATGAKVASGRVCGRDWLARLISPPHPPLGDPLEGIRFLVIATRALLRLVATVEPAATVSEWEPLLIECERFCDSPTTEQAELIQSSEEAWIVSQASGAQRDRPRSTAIAVVEREIMRACDEIEMHAWPQYYVRPGLPPNPLLGMVHISTFAEILDDESVVALLNGLVTLSHSSEPGIVVFDRMMLESIHRDYIPRLLLYERAS